MKKTILLIILPLIFTTLTIAQEETAPSKRVFLGIGTGVNSDTGIFGVVGNFGVSDKIMLGVGGGVGGWGGKVGASIQFHPKGYYKHFFKLGVSRASGIDEITITTETIENGSTDVTMKYNPVVNANVSFGYNFKVGKSSRFFMEGGFALNLTENPYEIEGNLELTEEGEQFMQILVPGGLRFALGFDFGL